MNPVSIAAFSRCCKALADPTRVRVLRLLAQAPSSLCVCEIKDALGVNLYNVSRHLKELKEAGFIQGSKTGRWVYHTLDQDLSSMHSTVVNAVLILSDDLLTQDTERLLKRLRLRQEERCVIGPAETLRQAQCKTSKSKGAIHAR